jgi:hypothetical protein
MDALYNHIAAKCERGIPLSEATRLMLTLYCTLGILPKELQGLKLSKVELGETFARLAGDGIIIPEENEKNLSKELLSPAYWVEVTQKLFRGEIQPDLSFLDRASRYV